MTIEFHLLDAMDEIPAQHKHGIMRELEAANERVAHHSRLDRLDIVVAPEAWVLREWGLCGYANGLGRITITFKESLNNPVSEASRGRGSLDLKFGDVPDRLGAALVVGGGPNGRYPRRSACFPAVPPAPGRRLPCHPVA